MLNKGAPTKVRGIEVSCLDDPSRQSARSRSNPLSQVTSKLIDYKRVPKGKSLFNPETESSSTTDLVELRAFVRKGGKLKYTLDGLRWTSEFTKEGGEGPPPGIVSM